MPSHSFQQAEILSSSSLEHLPFLKPMGDLSVPAGYAAPGFATSDDQQDRIALTQLAAKVLEDPLLLRQLGDRVYELMRLDLEQQRERSRNYGRLL